VGEKTYRTGREALTQSEVERLLSKIGNLEDELLLSLAVASGIRREDIVSILTANVQFSNEDIDAKITFFEAKKKRNWQVFISGQTVKLLRQHLNIIGNSKWLFPARGRTKSKGHLSGRTAYNVYQRYLQSAGIKGRPFHTLRATCMKLAKSRGWSVEQTMEQTGDTWRTVTEHYTTPSEQEMEDVAKGKAIL